eukprot:3783719-Pleurochrysis_carterae.AAC.1
MQGTSFRLGITTRFPIREAQANEACTGHSDVRKRSLALLGVRRYLVRKREWRPESDQGRRKLRV